MENKILENAEDSLALIRNKVKEGAMKSDFRKKLIGGISEEDVEDYINTIQKQFEFRENKLNEKIEELISFNDKLKIEYNTYKKNAEDEKKKLLQELEEAKQNLQLHLDQNNITDTLISETEEKYKTELEHINEELKRITFERDTLKERLIRSELAAIENEKARAAIEERLEQEQNSRSKILEENSELHTKSKSFNEEMKAMYKELASVKEQVQMNYELQRQLEQERSKTERVEKEMTDFFKRIIEIKG